MSELEEALFDARRAVRRSESTTVAAAASDAMREELQHEKERLQASNQRLQTTVAALREDLQVAKADAERKQDELQQTVQELRASLQQTREGAATGGDDAQRELDRAVREADASRAALKELERSNDALRADLHGKDEDIAVLQSEIDRLAAVVDTQEEELQRARGGEASLGFEVEETLAELAEQVREYAVAQADIDRLKVRCAGRKGGKRREGGKEERRKGGKEGEPGTQAERGRDSHTHADSQTRRHTDTDTEHAMAQSADVFSACHADVR